jgi:DnaJ-class molecular chaperone
MSSKHVKETEYYDIFNVKSDASQDEIKKAYLKLASKEHPDKCIDKSPEGIKKATEKFQNINYAYGILSDHDKRAVYDMNGKNGLDESQNGGGGNPFDMFSNIFGNNGFGFNGFNERMTRQKPKPPPTKHVLNVSLADLYTGKDCDIKFKQQIICTNCKGKGTTNPDGIKRCDNCQGKGQVTQLRQVGPGMVQQSVNVCSKCRGKGKIILNPNDLCNPCHGDRVAKIDKTIKFNLKPGSDFGTTFQINRMGDEYPDIDEPADLIIVTHETSGYNPSNLVKQNNDLHMNVELTLLEALCGFNLIICQLDGRKLIINHNNKTIQPNDIMKISNEGMPLSDKKGKGDMIIHFTVTLPKNLDNSRKDILKQVLPQNKRNNPVINETDITENKNLEEVKQSQQHHQHQHQHQHNQGQGNQFDFNMPNLDNLAGDMGQGVQCAQQ